MDAEERKQAECSDVGGYDRPAQSASAGTLEITVEPPSTGRSSTREDVRSETPLVATCVYALDPEDGLGVLGSRRFGSGVLGSRRVGLGTRGGCLGCRFGVRLGCRLGVRRGVRRRRGSVGEGSERGPFMG